MVYCPSKGCYERGKALKIKTIHTRKVMDSRQWSWPLYLEYPDCGKKWQVKVKINVAGEERGKNGRDDDS